MRYVGTQIDDDLYNEMVKFALAEDRTLANFLKVCIKTRIIHLTDQVQEEMQQ